MRESVRKSKNKLNDFKTYKGTCQNSGEALKYLKLHKNCPYGKLEYALALQREKKDDEAKEIFEDLLNTKNRNYALSNLIIMEFVFENYEKCYGYLKQFEKIDKDYFDQGRYKYLKYFCMTQLNIPVNVDYNNLDFMESIILKYDRNAVLNHIAYHNKDVYATRNKIADFNEKNVEQCFFADDVDIEKLYDEVSCILKLDEMKQNMDRGISSKIFFRYDNIGSNVKGRHDYLAVMILTNTDKIISLYPVMSVDKEYLVNKKTIFDFEEMLSKAKELDGIKKRHYRQ